MIAGISHCSYPGGYHPVQDDRAPVGFKRVSFRAFQKVCSCELCDTNVLPSSYSQSGPRVLSGSPLGISGQSDTLNGGGQNGHEVSWLHVIFFSAKQTKEQNQGEAKATQIKGEEDAAGTPVRPP